MFIKALTGQLMSHMFQGILSIRIALDDLKKVKETHPIKMEKRALNQSLKVLMQGLQTLYNHADDSNVINEIRIDQNDLFIIYYLV